MPEDRRYRRDRQRNRKDEKKKEDDVKKIILAKKEPSTKATTPDAASSSSQPKLLLKARDPVTLERASSQPAPAIEASESSSKEPEISGIQPSETSVMSKPLKLLTPEHVFNIEAITPYIQEHSSDFLVVAFVGPQNCGKSSLANWLLDPVYNLSDLQKLENKMKFQTRSKRHVIQLSPITEGIDIFITKDRLVILDCGPLLANALYKDYILSEMDDLKTLSFLLNVCNLVILVQETYVNPNIMRLIHAAEMMRMRNSEDDHLAKVMIVHNKLTEEITPKFTTEMKSLYKTVFGNSNINCYLLQSMNEEELKTTENVHFVAIPKLKDSKIDPVVKKIIDNFRIQVFMSKRYRTKHSQVTQFNEKTWLQSLTKTWDALSSNYFFKKYANLKEKFNLLNHVSISDGIKYENKNVYYPDD